MLVATLHSKHMRIKILFIYGIKIDFKDIKQ